MNNYFGEVRWCKEDLEVALKNKGLPVTENNLSRLYVICSHHWFRDYTIEAGWEFINNNIDNYDNWDK